MKVVGLISGGKDSCFNLMQCVAEGHEIVALANLKPHDKDELDSYMYQTVGHHAIDLYAEAMDLPLYRREIQGNAVRIDAHYEETKDDEVEDLYKLLAQIKEELHVDAVAVGAILSDYQRVRVENVCSRLGLSVLGYLWRRDQVELLSEMIACHVDAIVIKVASLGLMPKDHLGKTIKDLYPHLLKMKEVYGLNACGEGGEYETFTLDCPLFVKRIVLDESEMVMHSDDAFAPVAYLNLKRMHLEDKPVTLNKVEDLKKLPLKHSCHLVSELFPEGIEKYEGHNDVGNGTAILVDHRTESSKSPEPELHLHPCVRRSSDGYTWISGLAAYRLNEHCIEDEVRLVLDQLKDTLAGVNLSLKDLVAIHLYVANMEDFAAINSIYKKYFSVNPPVRVCVEVPLAKNLSLSLDCVAYDNKFRETHRQVMHVQGISHWAPANIGPYSQAIVVGQHVYVAGQIALSPATMKMVDGGAVVEARLSLRHVDRILKAMNASLGLHRITLAICYVTNTSTISVALKELERAMDMESENSERPLSDLPLVTFVHVPALPRQAQIEWHVVAISNEDRQKDVVQTSTVIDGVIYKIHARKHWTSEDSFVLPFIIVVELVNEKVSPEHSLEKKMSSMLHQMADLLKKQGCSYKDLHCLRLFYSVEAQLHTDIQNTYGKNFCHIFQCSDDGDVTAFIPVLGFQSSCFQMILCHS